MANQLIMRNKDERILIFKALIKEKRKGFIVNGRKLQNALENNIQYSKWIARKIEQNNLIETVDYLIYNGTTQKVEENQILDKSVLQVSHGGSNRLEYALTVKATQRIAGKDRSDVGYELLDYLFDLSEIQLKQDSYLIDNKIMRAERWIEEQKEKLQLEESNKEKQLLIEEQKPKADFYDTIATSKTGIELKLAVKVLNLILPKTGKTIGRTDLFAILRERGILDLKNKPYQKYIDNGYFRLIQKTYTQKHRNGTTTQEPYTQVLLHPKGIDQIRKMLIKLGYQIKEDYMENKKKHN